MANCCTFSIEFRGRTAEDADRFEAVLMNRDPEFCIIRSWPSDMFVSDGEGTERRVIDGVCPWTADYFWDPEETIYGSGMIPGETRMTDGDGRTLASVPQLCRLLGGSARGWHEEPCCDVGGTFECGPDGVLRYEDDYGEAA